MKQTISPPPGSSPRQGIALLMVLGMLVVLAIMALGFVVYVRTERISSKYTVDDASGMDLLQAGIHRSAEYVNGNLSSNGWITAAHRSALSDNSRWPGHNDNDFWYDRSYSGPKDGAYGGNHQGGSHRWYITINPHNNQGYMTDIPRGTNYESARFLHPIVTQRDGRTVSNGVFTFEAFDQSGLMDVNQIGREAYVGGALTTPIPRYQGLSPTEIDSRPIGSLSARFMAMRNVTPRFFSRMEMDTCGATLSGWAGVGSGSDVLQNTSDLGLMLSYFPAGWCEWDTPLGDFVAREALYIGAPSPPFGDMQAVLSDPAVGLSDGGLMNNIRDYVDSDRVPQSLGSYCTEAVPLINEVAVETVDAGGGSNRYDITVELWYPFTKDPPSPQVTVDVETDAPPANRTTGIIVGPTQASRFIAPVLRGTPGPPLPQINIKATVKVGGVAVDQVENIRISSPGVGQRAGKAANDPRLNWDGNDASQWQNVGAANLTLNAYNVHTCTASNAVNDGHWAIFVRDGAIQVPGELGLLLYDGNRPWQTIDLTNPRHAKILERFTTRTNEAMRGLVNPNTTYPRVWEAVLAWSPMARYPDESPSMLATNRGTNGASIAMCLSTSLVGRVARQGTTAYDPKDWGWAWRYNLNREIFYAKLPETSYTNVSDAAVQIGRFFWDDPSEAQALTGARPDRSQVEGLIRNTSCLLSTRQNLFGVYIRSSVMDLDGNTRGGALDYFFWLWRDPYLTRHGSEYIHRMFIPSIQPLP